MTNCSKPYWSLRSKEKEKERARKRGMEGQKNMIDLLTVDAQEARKVVASGRRYLDVRFIFIFFFQLIIFLLCFQFAHASIQKNWTAKLIMMPVCSLLVSDHAKKQKNQLINYNNSEEYHKKITRKKIITRLQCNWIVIDDDKWM